jgi:hypothetical protein
MPGVNLGGHRYYPDHIVRRDDLTIALEIKRYTGQSSVLHQVIGQSVIYAQKYGFVIAFIADETRSGRLAQVLNGGSLPADETKILANLWEHHNVKVVCRHVEEVVVSEKDNKTSRSRDLTGLRSAFRRKAGAGHDQT